jgi:hypothetical protein
MGQAIRAEDDGITGARLLYSNWLDAKMAQR